MFIQAPRTRSSITPTNVRPIHSCLTPNSYVLNMTQRVEERQPLQIKIVDNNNSFQSIIIKPNSKESLTRIPGSSFCHSSSSTELQNQIQELKKQKENMCLTLQEAFKKNNQLQQRFEHLKNEKQEQAYQFQVNLKQFTEEINQMSKKLENLIAENSHLQEQYESQQFYIEQLESQSSDPFNVTQNFGQM